MQTPGRTVTTPLEAIGISTLCFGWFILGSLVAVSSDFRSASFSDEGFIGLIVVEVILGAIAILVLRSRGFSVGTLYPVPSIGGVAAGCVLYLAATLAAALVASPFGSAEYNEPVERLIGSGNVSLSTLVIVGLVNGAYEEVFLLGFLVRGLRGYGLSVGLGVSLLVRILYHLYQGPLGALWVLAFGAVVSVYFVASGRLFPAVLAHAIADIVPFMLR